MITARNSNRIGKLSICAAILTIATAFALFSCGHSNRHSSNVNANQFDQFYKKFTKDIDIGNGAIPTDIADLVDEDFINCIAELGGKTFNGGLYRVYRGDQIEHATETMTEVFPKLHGEIVCFGYDWLGRNFAMELLTQSDSQPKILLLEPGAGEVMEIPASIIGFHNNELVKFTNGALAENFYYQWHIQQKASIQPDQCVGYKVPLFLGGPDTIENLELIDMEVYLNICGQLLNNVKTLPNGTTINGVSIE